MRQTNKNIKRIISDLEDGIYDIERAKDDLEDMKEELAEILNKAEQNTDTIQINITGVLQWFESPFVSDYDKRIVIEKFKK